MTTKLSKGDAAPDFVLENQDGEEVTLKSYRGKKVLLYFYPKASTSGCKNQSCAVNEALPELNKLNCEAIGMSADTVKRQKNFAVKNDYNFPLLADLEHVIGDQYGIWGQKKMCGKEYMGIIRSSFLIDEEGKILEAWYKVSPKDTVPKAMAALEA